MPDPTASADPTAASRQRVNLTTEFAARGVDYEVALADVERGRYAQAILTMLAQALSVEELERICHHVQWPLERSAIDKATAARAIINHIDVVIRARLATEQRGMKTGDWPVVIRARNEIAFQQQIRARWAMHLPESKETA